MSSTALATRSAAPVAMRNDNLDTLTVAKMLAESGFFGEVRDAGKALAKILAGQELGMGPIASLMGVYYQQGKVTYSANIMAAAVKKSGRYTYRVQRLDDQACALEFFERQGTGWSSLGVSDFTTEQADTAGLLTGPNKHNWKNWRRNMLFARAMSNGAKWYTPDVFGGVPPYTPDELGAEVSMGDGGDMVPVITDAPAPAPITGEVVQESPVEDVPVWVSTYHTQWAKGAALAREIGAPIPEKLEPSEGRATCEARLRELAAGVKARRARLDLEGALRDVIKVAIESGVDFFEVPENISELEDADLRAMIADAQAAIPTTEADLEELPA